MAGVGVPQFVNRSAQEHLLYIQEKVNPILEALVTAVLLERPEDPSFFMLKWLCEQTKTLEGASSESGNAASGMTTAEEIAAVRAEIEKLKKRKSTLLADRGIRIEGGGKDDGYAGTDDAYKTDTSTKADDEEEEEEDDDDDGPDLPPEPPKGFSRGPRQSVSAEAYGNWNVKGTFTAPVYEKSEAQKTTIQNCIAGSFLFNALDKDDLNTVTLAFKERLVAVGECIIKQGDDGESMFLIEEGKVDCLKKMEDGSNKVVKTCGQNDVFGELALLYNCPRAATVECTEKGRLWELDRETFNRIVKDAAASKRTKYTEFLQKVPLFANIDSYEMMTVADALKMTDFDKEGEQVINQGDAGDKFFVVLEGECIAKKVIVPGAEPTKVMTHKAGDYFGELSLLKNEPRAASVYTSAPTKLLWMDRKTFKRLLGPVEDILRREAKRYELPSA